MQDAIVYFDIAAVVIMFVAMGSVLIRKVTHGPTYYTYFSLVVVITLTCLASMCSQLYDNAVTNAWIDVSVRSNVARDLMRMAYFVLRSVNPLAYLVFIAVVSNTTHRLRRNLVMRLAFWAPIAVAMLVILTNPLHGGVFAYTNDVMHRGGLMWVIYLCAIYYSLWGVGHLVRWRKVLVREKFLALMALYPMNLVAVLIQTFMPKMRVEMFFTAVAVMLVSILVMRPEEEIDDLTGTLSLKSFEEMCRRAFIIERPLCLVFIDIANKDRLRALAGPGMFRNIVRAVSLQVKNYNRRGDELYYLRNGLFCISAHNLDASESLAIALRSAKEGREAAKALPEQSMVVQLRTCVVRVPQDVGDDQTLQTFTRRIGRVIPEPCVTTYEELSRHKGFLLQMNLANIVERGIAERAFEVYYQPIWNVQQKRFCSAEALVRLHDPEFGYVSPGLFIPEAEQSGAIVDVGRIVLQKICQFLGTVDFAATQLEYVELNLSVEQCMQPDLVPQLLGLLKDNHVESRRINLEITETSESYSQTVIDNNMRALAQVGITLSLDDYGSGYSSLARMFSLPIDVVKLDKSLVDGMGDPAVRTVVADTVVTMQKIGKKVLVEGVETEEQSKELVGMGVDYLQGYLYARPLCEEDFIAFLMERNASALPYTHSQQGSCS
ncbi:MAG: EAL domain-containing protein [Coriobacteriales bacterium]|nr:EAL domain-containing protein [Coriobacteriales bacterium]